MAIDIVVELEEVDIDDEDGERLTGMGGAQPFGLELKVEAAAIGEAGESVGVGQFAIALFTAQEGAFEILSLFEQSCDGEGREEGDGDEDLNDHDAVGHAGAWDEHQRTAACDGKDDRDRGDNEDGEDGAGESAAEDDQEEGWKDEEGERIGAVVKDEDSNDGRDGDESESLWKLPPPQHEEEARALQDEDQRGDDGHAKHVAQIPGAEDAPPGGTSMEELDAGCAEKAGQSRGADDGDDKESDERAAFGEVERVAEPARKEQAGDDDFGGVGGRNAEREQERIAAEQVGAVICDEAYDEITQPAAARAGNDEREEHAIGEPYGGDAFGLTREDDAEPGAEQDDEEGGKELNAGGRRLGKPTRGVGRELPSRMYRIGGPDGSHLRLVFT